jgi:hypothetical protein
VACQLRKLQGSGCAAECVPDGMRTTCTNGDGCCPGGCTANNDNDCQPRCGNGAVESGETCDPVSACQAQADTCVSDRNFDRKPSGSVALCTFRCTSTARTCSATSDNACPLMPACTPCGATCGPNQDIDCKLANGAVCTHRNQCGTACVDGRCCESACTAQCRSCAVAGSLGLCRPIPSGPDTNSSPVCSGNNTCSSGACKLGPGQPCTANADCAAGACTTFLRDADGDGYGNPSVTSRACGSTPPAGHVSVGGDCCDSDINVNPAQTMFFPGTSQCGGRDFNCNGTLEPGITTLQNCSTAACQSGWSAGVPACGTMASWLFCHRTGPGGGFCDQITEQRAQTCR